MPEYLAQYNASAVIRFPLVVRNSVDLAVKATFTPANGDCNISKDGGAQANPTNNLNIVTGTTWNITLSATELSAKEVIVMVRNNTVVEDQWIRILTYGNASAFFQGDLTAANIAADVKAISGNAVNTANAQVGAAVVSVANNAVTENAFDATAGTFKHLGIIDQGIAQNTTANSIKIRSAAPFNSNEITGAIAVISSGTGQGQSRAIISYNAANNTAQVDAWTTTPNATTAYKIFAGAPASSTPPDVTVASMSNNSLKQFFNTDSGSNYNVSVAGSVVKEIADNSGGASLTNDSILARLNSNLVLGNQTFSLTGSVSGSVGSVTGNVGAVTGNIGGNVAGSVGSVTGNVAAVTGNVGGNLAGTIGGLTANALKQFFNTNSTSNYNVSVAGSVVKEIADNAGGSSLTTDAILGRLNSNLVLPDQNINIVGNITGSLSGSVGSVTGNVAAVTGNIGGNLAGSVGSVLGNVAAVTGNIGGNLAGSVGSVTATVNAAVLSVANNAITALSLNANAITGAKVGNDVDIRNVTGNVSGTVGSVTGNVAAVTGNIGGNVAGSVGSVVGFNAALVDAKVSATATPAQVKTQVVAALATDTYAEPAQGTPASTDSLANKISLAYKLQINKLTQTNNTLSVFDATGATVDHKASVSDVNNVFTRGNLVSGP